MSFGFKQEKQPPALPAPQDCLVIRTLQRLIDADKPFHVEIIVAGDFQKITVKDEK